MADAAACARRACAWAAGVRAAPTPAWVCIQQLPQLSPAAETPGNAALLEAQQQGDTVTALTGDVVLQAVARHRLSQTVSLLLPAGWSVSRHVNGVGGRNRLPFGVASKDAP